MTLVSDTMIMSVKLLTSDVFCELPGDGHLATVPVLGPGTNLFGQVLHGVDPTVETLFRKGGKLDFGHIQPAAFVGCVDHLETLRQTERLFRRECLIE